jgi:hypothetical protein
VLLAKLQPTDVLSEATILAYANTVDADDWRLPYHGAALKLRTFSHDKNDKLVPGTYVANVLLAIPCDDAPTHKGGLDGASWRALGCIAVYAGRRADGTYRGVPSYITEEELAALWID